MLDLIQWRARKTPEAPALFFNGRWYSYREMESRANRLSNRLLSLGVRKGDRVGVIARNHPVHFDLLFAAPKIGIVFVPFNPYAEPEHMAAMAETVKPAMLFVGSRHHDVAVRLGMPWTRLSDYREWLQVGSQELPPVPALSVDDPHLIFDTAKGAAVQSYQQVLLNARHAGDAWQLTAQDSTVHCLPCFGPELNLLCLPLIYRSGRVVLMSSFDADELLGHLALHRSSIVALPPQLLYRLTAHPDFDEADLSGLNWLGSVGAPASLPVRERLAARGLSLRALLASAEVGPNLFAASLTDQAECPALLGVPLPDVELSTSAVDHAPSEVGELRIAGPMVFSGYLDARQVVHAPQLPLASGLLAEARPDGQYRICGSHFVVCNGQTIYTGRIEAAMQNCAHVVESAVIGVNDPVRGVVIVAVLSLQDGAPLDVDALRATLANELPPELCPGQFQRLAFLPRDSWGRVDYDALVRQFTPS